MICLFHNLNPREPLRQVIPAGLQLPHETGEEELGVFFDGHFGAGAGLAETVQEDEAVRLKDTPCLGAPVPGFAGQGEEMALRFCEFVCFGHAHPPLARL